MEEYVDYFRPWVEEGYEIIHINIGGALSSSHQNCCLAASELGHVYPVDSCNLSSHCGPNTLGILFETL
ncbi:MAG TPA: DegV family protein [Lachnoclostridium phocaeense]|uniref:DegV family protein n=1 Tax=Lachnoclostridium phocaeense TaxID=1871021 RepID=A0A921I2U5_9FIRM|nr:DegV family protein [Lachnoclostridium phocaeense]